MLEITNINICPGLVWITGASMHFWASDDQFLCLTWFMIHTLGSSQDK